MMIMTTMLAAKISVHLLCMNFSEFFIHNIASYPHTNTKNLYYYYCFHFIDEKNEVQRWIKRALYLPGEIIFKNP